MDMIQPNWIWTATGDLSINGTHLVAQGTPGSVVAGELTLQLPPNAVPKRHAFIDTDSNDVDATLNISLHVLQVYRANLTIIEPISEVVGEPLSLNVSEPHRFLLFLENPGTASTPSSLLQAQHLLTHRSHPMFPSPILTLRKRWVPWLPESALLISLSRKKRQPLPLRHNVHMDFTRR